MYIINAGRISIYKLARIKTLVAWTLNPSTRVCSGPGTAKPSHVRWTCYPLELLNLPRSQIDVQRPLLPESIEPVIFHPVFARLIELQIKVPDETREQKSHFRICETENIVSIDRTEQRVGAGNGGLLLPDAITRPVGKWLEAILPIVCKAGVIQPALWYKLIG